MALAGTTEALSISASAARQAAALKARDGTPDSVFRVLVSGGGCSGFQYNFSLEDAVQPDDKIFERHGVKVVVDETSLDLVKGSEITYVEELVGSYFKMTNPNAKSSCGCGTSFSI